MNKHIRQIAADLRLDAAVLAQKIIFLNRAADMLEKQLKHEESLKNKSRK